MSSKIPRQIATLINKRGFIIVNGIKHTASKSKDVMTLNLYDLCGNTVKILQKPLNV